MSEPKQPADPHVSDQLGTVFHPKNLLKTVASQVPLASAGVEMLNQLEGQRVEKRIAALEQTDAGLLAKLHELEASAIKSPPARLVDWPLAVTEFLRRNVEFAIIHTPRNEFGHEYVLPVANGCLVGNDCVLTSSEALEFATAGARMKGGRLVMLIDWCWYEFQPEPVDGATGLVLCKLTKRDEEKYHEARMLFQTAAVNLSIQPLPEDPPKWTITPSLGQEVGFIVPSDSQNNMRQMEMTHVEFGTSVISHFRKPRHNALKVFVTAPYPGRIPQVGAAAFSRDGTLLGIISEVESYRYDAGRRAVVKTLLGFPRFTTPKLKPCNPT